MTPIATEPAAFLYRALARTVEHDLGEEIAFLLGFDAARSRFDALMDWPAQVVDRFVRMVHRNGGPLSRIKRQSHFGWITAEEVVRCEAIVREELRLLSGWEGGMASASVDGT